MLRFLIPTLAATGCALAQDQLVEVGQAEMIGGPCRKILIAKDQRHALTVGRFSDLIWWDLETREKLREIAGRELHSTTPAIHPRQPIVAASWGFGTARQGVFGIRMDTGERMPWLRQGASRMAFDATGRYFAAVSGDASSRVPEPLTLSSYRVSDLIDPNVLAEPIHQLACANRNLAARPIQFADDGSVSLGEPQQQRSPWEPVSSPDGKITAKYVYDGIEVDDEKIPYESPSVVGTFAITNDKTLFVAEAHGRLTIQDGNDQTRFASHRGNPDQILFSADGTHLAITTAAAVRIVDRLGMAKRTIEGSRLVVPADDGAEFWLIDRDGMQRWDAATRLQVGERITWPGTHVELVRKQPTSRWAALRSSLVRSYRSQLVTRRGDTFWLPTDEWLPGYFQRNDGKDWHGIPEAAGVPSGLLRIPGSDRHAYQWSAENKEQGGCTSHLKLFDATGQLLAKRDAGYYPNWMAVDDSGAHVWVDAGDFLGFSGKDLELLVRHEETPAWRHGIAWHDDTLLVTNGADLTVIDPSTLAEQQRFEIPAGLRATSRWAPHIELLAASPDRRHIALASGCRVHIFRLTAR